MPGNGGVDSILAAMPPVFSAARSGHIFRVAEGHVAPATAASQARFVQLFQSVASNPANLNMNVVKSQLAIDMGVQGFSQTFRNGQQVWVTVRNGEIIDAGVNAAGAVR